ADRFGLHPALLDSALHALLLTRDAGEGQRLPFAWDGVGLHASGASALRVRLTDTGTDQVAIEAADLGGQPVLSVRTLRDRPQDGTFHGPAASGETAADSLFLPRWLPRDAEPATTPQTVGVLGEGLSGLRGVDGLTVVRGDDLGTLAGLDPVPDTVLVDVRGTEAAGGREVRSVTARVLELVHAWLADERLAVSRLVAVTRGAAGPGGPTDLAASAVWGLLRTAQSEHPGRFGLLDVESDQDVAVGLALPADEPQVVVRGGIPLVGRLARMPAGDSDPATARAWDPEGTVLVTGDVAGLAGALVRHLVVDRGQRHVVLAARSDADREVLEQEAAAHGAEVAVAVCDLADAAAVRALVSELERPLTAVVYAEEAFDDDSGLISGLSAERLATVLAPKVEGAWNLHEATLDQPLAAFVLYSSITGIIGVPGRAGHAAADTYLDALAAYRQETLRLPGVSIAWGPWEDLGRSADAADARTGPFARIDVDRGLAMFDAATDATHASLVAIALRTPRSSGGLDSVPAMFRDLIGARRRSAAGITRTAADTAQQIAAMPPQNRIRHLTDLVRTQAAAVLGHNTPDRVRTDREFKQFGFDSLTAVELRNRLMAATGLRRLPATLVFDYATPGRLAEYLLDELCPQGADDTGPSVLTELDRLESVMAAAELDEVNRVGIATRLRQLLDRCSLAAGGQNGAESTSEADRIQAATTEEIFALIDDELGRRSN
ncbi:type I polyketide synthase, partial [Streptomyces sp. MCC20]